MPDQPWLTQHPEWLPGDLGDRLERIRTSVRRLWDDTTAHNPQPPWFTPHGPDHFVAVERLLHELIPGDIHHKLNPYEKFLLLAAAWLHDLGMLKGLLPNDQHISDHQVREDHHIRTAQYLVQHATALTIADAETGALGQLAQFHRRRHPLLDCPENRTVRSQDIRLRLLAAYLRLADALHVDQTRAPLSAYAEVLAYDIPDSARLHWLKSQFLDAAQPKPDQHKIVLQFRRPPSPPATSDDDEALLQAIYDQVAVDLIDELNSVKDILLRGELSYFLEVEKVVVRDSVAQPNLEDFRSVFTHRFLLDIPSSSAMSAVLLRSANYIAEKPGLEPAVAQELSRFLNEIEAQVLRTRRCHIGLKKLVGDLQQSIAQVQPLAEVRRTLNRLAHESTDRRQAIERNAGKCFNVLLAPHGDVGSPHFDVLLYGYSEQVASALLGFRQALTSKLLQRWVEDSRVDPDSNRPYSVAEAETDAADVFRLFVCEGQPKNRTEWGGRLAYHDGVRYAELLRSRGFQHIYIIPDAVAPTLLAGVAGHQGAPHIRIVMVGANGFDSDYFVHSAGHLSVVTAAHSCRPRDSQDSQLPLSLVLLVVGTDKFSDVPVRPLGAHGRSDAGGSVVSNGWSFAGSFGDEPVRTTTFMSPDPTVRDLLRGERSRGLPVIQLYNPREDIVPIHLAEVVVTERAWLYQDWEQQWSGDAIAQATQSSQRSGEGDGLEAGEASAIAGG